MSTHPPFDEADLQLDIRLDNAIWQYERDREAYFAKLGLSEKRAAIDAIGGDIYRASQQLTEEVPAYSSDVDWDAIGDDVLSAVGIHLAKEFQQTVAGMEVRCGELSAQVLARAPSERVLRFVRRLTRCYTAGFLPECVILCRAVLETAVRDRFSVAIESVGGSPARPLSMKEKLLVAQERGWLSPEAAEDAWTVWTRGNKAVHDDPTATGEVFETIRMTVAVIEDLLDDSSPA